MRDLVAIAERSAEYGWLGLAIFGACLFVGTLSFVPRNLFSMTGGFLFGWISLPVVILVSAASTAFGTSLSRYALRDFVLRAGGRRARAVVTAIDQDGWRVIFLLAFAGPFPHAMQVVINGMTKMPVARLTALASIAHMPQNILYVGVGVMGADAVAHSVQPIKFVWLLLVIATSLAVFVLVTRRARRILAIDDETAAGESSNATPAG